MQRRIHSRSPKKNAKRTSSPRKPCSNCLANRINQIHLSRSLYRKYSFSQNHVFLARINLMQVGAKAEESTRESGEEAEEEFLGRYHKAASRRAALVRAKEVYRMHRDIPRLFQPILAALLAKCHHRKRLLDYFKLAKTLGLRVESLAFSSFMLSLHLKRTNSTSYSQVLGPNDLSEEDDVERGLLLAIDQG